MRNKTWLLFAVVAVAVFLIATPLSAKEPLRGDQVMVLNENLDGTFGAFGCPELSWFGEIEIGGTTYGMALYPLPGSRFTGHDRVLHYIEGWKIFDGQFTLGPDFIIDDCGPGDVLLAGTDSGVGSLATGKFHSTGVVEDADAPFAEWLDRKVFQDGTLGPIVFEGKDLFGFYGGLRLH